ncbi:hypothetical protein GH714_042802 [Hevea brasiliensis]|uniref:S1 motif domain-containing protein n=1 Tax=Hevea brasiliensis TaxID=3981 RepID=A0A6A6K1F5_HEVBR|nr:hypothetical protein GH714_042802 [Hevea brasiliensis]
MLPVMILYGLYVQVHGDYSPGGGFQGGVIVASALVLYHMVFGAAQVSRVVSASFLQGMGATGLLLYIVTGAASTILGKSFLSYFFAVLDAVSEQKLGIFIVELGVGLVVCGSMSSVLLFYISLGYVRGAKVPILSGQAGEAFGKRILVDAAYVDEIRVAVLDDGKVVEFDQELKDRKQLRGNIYYAVVKRIEPSLQAVFIEYGISKHGFLPFSEISVEHYQLPVEEKEALLQNMYGDGQEHEGFAEDDGAAAPLPDDGPVDACKPPLDDRSGKNTASKTGRSKSSLHKLYKIQDVVKVDQKLMVQIIKEERGNKCATFSTYVALAGRYCIFMPNAGNKNSGISRRIEDCDDRKNLKEVLNSIKLPKESGVIIRTAGSNRSQKEIEQDLSYLQSTWQEIRDNCEKMEPPALLYVEANIIKRALRDFCDETIHDVVVSGSRRSAL